MESKTSCIELLRAFPREQIISTLTHTRAEIQSVKSALQSHELNHKKRAFFSGRLRYLKHRVSVLQAIVSQ